MMNKGIPRRGIEEFKGGSCHLQKGTKEDQNRSRELGKDLIHLTDSTSSITARHADK